jgi:hypothetical protein
MEDAMKQNPLASLGGVAPRDADDKPNDEIAVSNKDTAIQSGFHEGDHLSYWLSLFQEEN